MSHVEIGAALDLAATQHGVLTTAELADLGFSRSAVSRLVAAGARFEADRRRRARAEAIGGRVPSFTWAQVTRRPLWVATTVERILDVAGWNWRAA